MKHSNKPEASPYRVKLSMLLMLPLLGITAVACTMSFAPITAMSQSSTVEAATAREVAENAAWSSNVNITFTGTNMTITSNGIPSHERADFYLIAGRAQADSTGTVNTTYTMPLEPEYTGNATATGPGAIGIAVSGAVFFNAYEGDQVSYAIENNPVQNGVAFIDACNGHPLPMNGQYHYHGIPYCITDALDTAGEHSVLIGYIRDGFPIYGPQDVGGSAPTDLDQCNGHFGATPEFPEGTYHYHTSEVRSYVPNCYMGEAPAGGGGGQQGGGPPGGGPPGN